MRYAALLALLTVACDGAPPSVDGGPPDAGARPATQAVVGYNTPDDLFAAPWPDERLRRPDGTVDVSAFPNPRGAPIADDLRSILEGARGFGVSSGIYFALTGPLDPASLPDPAGSIGADASVFLLDVARGERVPIDVRYLEDAGTFSPDHLLAVLPLQGRPLRPEARYAAVVTTAARSPAGEPLVAGEGTRAIAAGEPPPGLDPSVYDAQRSLLDQLDRMGVDRDRVAATALFTTWDPTAELRAAQAQLATMDPPALEADFTAAEVFDELCVYHATVRMPDFQGGEAPYLDGGGAWVYEGGALAVQRMAQANLWVTLPRRPMPADGFPVAVFVRTGGGGDRPLVDRGPRATAGGDAITPGTGPALHFARAGFAGVSVDGPLGGLRNTDGWDEQFAIFNINNVRGLRDNVRQSALELIHLVRLLGTVAIDASGCPDLTTPTAGSVALLDPDTVALMGHSMGATIAPLAVALEPAYDAAILSGAGASWSRNVIFKESPIAVRPAAENLLRYPAGSLVEHDPVLALLQWAGEPADPQVYARHLLEEPIAGEARHVLMFQGILDTYIPPPVANPLALAIGLDQAGPALDEALSDRFTPLSAELPLAGGAQIGLPASANRAGRVAVVVQHAEDGIEDGHEVVFQTPGPQLQYRCFLSSLAAGAPQVPATDATDCP